MSQIDKYDIKKQYSQLVIMHAISQLKEAGKNQKDLAALIGIPEPRITEAKNGAYTLNARNIEEIGRRFGLPKRGKGRYVRAELYHSLDDFFKDYSRSAKARHLDRLSTIAGRRDYRDLLASFASFEGYNCFDENPDFTPEQVYELIEAYLGTSEMRAWFTDISAKMKADNSRIQFPALPATRELPVKYFCMPDMFRQEVSWSLLWLMYWRENTKNHTSLAPPLEHPFVLTGDVVLSEGVRFRENQTLNAPSDILGNYSELRSFTAAFHSAQTNRIDHEINAKPDFWVSAELSLYFSEGFQYNLLLELKNDSSGYSGDAIYPAPKRNIVINNIPVTALFTEIEKLRKWLGMAEDMEDQIKEKIAEAGGYIPGARVL